MDDQAIVDRYREWQRTRGLSPETLRCYRAVYRPFIAWLEARGMNLMTVQPADIAEWITECGARCNRTRSIYVTRLDLLFRWMADEEIRLDVPSRRIPKPKFPHSLPRPIPTEGLHRAMEAADPRMALMLALAAYAGLRRAEIANLTRSDILDDRDPPLILIHGKGDKDRLVPIGPVLADAMSRYHLPTTGAVFPGRYGGCISPQSVGLIVSRHLRSCGIDATTHQGRHWFATQLYRASRDLRVTQEMLGHASPSTTAVYAAWSPERAVTAIAALPARTAEPEEAA